MQTDMFGTESEHAALIAAQPEVLRPRCEPVKQRPTTQPQLDAWTRETQRIYLLYLVGSIARTKYRESSITHARYVLTKLNGLAGEW